MDLEQDGKLFWRENMASGADCVNKTTCRLEQELHPIGPHRFRCGAVGSPAS
jgi:hypothetical protein